VLVHGLGSRWQSYEPIIDILAAHHDVVAVDLPGFGGTAPDLNYRPSADGYARWLIRFLEDLDIKRPHVVGNSLGGGIALELGRLGVASRVTAFAPIGFWKRAGRVWCQGVLTGLRGAGTTLRPALDRMVNVPALKTAFMGAVIARPALVSTDAAMGHSLGLVTAPSYRAARDSFADYHLRPGDDLGRLPLLPVTIAWGTRDFVLTYRTQSARAHDVLPFARHLDLPGCGHVPFSDDPVLCARVILDPMREDD
jgi:pimeloyl-ACP methyl ester carboxylesterase